MIIYFGTILFRGGSVMIKLAGNNYVPNDKLFLINANLCCGSKGKKTFFGPLASQVRRLAMLKRTIQRQRLPTASSQKFI